MPCYFNPLALHGLSDDSTHCLELPMFVEPCYFNLLALFSNGTDKT